MVEIDGGGAVALRQVEVDGGGPRIEPVVGERLVHRHDLVLVEVGDAGRGPVRPPRPRFEPGGPLEAVAAEQLEEPAGTHVVGGRQLLDRPPGPQMRLDQEPSHVHRSTPPLGGVLCLDTCPATVSYVLKSDTVFRSRETAPHLGRCENVLGSVHCSAHYCQSVCPSRGRAGVLEAARGSFRPRGPTHSNSASTAVRIRFVEAPLADAHSARQPIGCPARAQRFGGTADIASAVGARTTVAALINGSPEFGLCGHRPQSPVVSQDFSADSSAI